MFFSIGLEKQRNGHVDKFDPQGEGYLAELDQIARDDVAGLKKAQASYGNSWKSRGGVGAFMMLARKWDRLENRLKRVVAGSPIKNEAPGANRYDIFEHVEADQRSEGVIDDIRDLRRYLLLVESDLVARGFGATHRDNAEDSEKAAMNAHLRLAAGGYAPPIQGRVQPTSVEVVAPPQREESAIERRLRELKELRLSQEEEGNVVEGFGLVDHPSPFGYNEAEEK